MVTMNRVIASDISLRRSACLANLASRNFLMCRRARNINKATTRTTPSTNKGAVRLPAEISHSTQTSSYGSR